MNSIGSALQAIETELERQSAELSGPMLEVCRYATAGGRRTRAMLLLGAVQQDHSSAVLAATALEMIHAATLLQDDIFDAGNLRRGRPAAHVCFGKPLAILASDWLLIRALEVAAEIDHRFFRCLAKAGMAMVQAEACEFTPATLRSLEEAQDHGCAIARGKTAALFGAALCGAAVLQRIPEDDRTRWEQIGIEMGLTYQMVDDCVDLCGVEDTAGKTLGHDLTAGCLTLPVLLAARSLEQRGTPISLRRLQARSLTTPERVRLRDEARSPNVKAQLHALLQNRFATHRKQALNAKLSAAAIDSWLADLMIRLEPCFRDALSPADDAAAFTPGISGRVAAWRSHA